MVGGFFVFLVIGIFVSAWYTAKQRSELMSGVIISKILTKRQLLINEFNGLNEMISGIMVFSANGDTPWRYQSGSLNIVFNEFYQFANTCSGAMAHDVSRFRAINDFQYPHVEDSVLDIMTIAQLKPKLTFDRM